MEFVDLFIKVLQECGIAYSQILLFAIELGIEHGEQTFGRLDRRIVMCRHIGTQCRQLAQLKQGV